MDIQYTNERLLIISNNVLSTTRNNGKTIFSYIDILPSENVAQLYFHGELPTIEGYRYFQITDKNIFKGLFSPQKRGQAQIATTNTPNNTPINYSKKLRRNNFTLFCRELLWFNKWKSSHLLKWLDDFHPTAIFFVGGDSGFAYSICRFIADRYHARVSLYITDDYIMPRMHDSLIGKLRRVYLKNKVSKFLEHTDVFFTVSEPMRKTYKELFGYDSTVIVNMTESLKMDHITADNEKITLVYTGSLYYGRDKILGKIAEAIRLFNQSKPEKEVILRVYTNTVPDTSVRKNFEISGCSEYSGSLGKEELKVVLNQADILVFVESFDKEQIEKTKYSLSTKVPEYLSVGKPIFAVGPSGIGSMEYLKDAAMCVNQPSAIDEILFLYLSSNPLRDKLGNDALVQFESNHLKSEKQQFFVKKVFGAKNEPNGDI